MESGAELLIEPPGALLVGMEEEARFRAVLLRPGGTRISASKVGWRVLDPGVALIDEGGLVAPRSAGKTEVLATVDGKVAQAKLEVYIPPVTGSYAAGQSYFGREGYVEYAPGTLPLVLSAGHGGALRPDEIPDRRYGVLVGDAATIDLARRVAAEIDRIMGEAPHVVYSHLHRRKLDPNRELAEAAQGSRAAELAWTEYHGWIEQARAEVERTRGRGLYLDIHGHAHPIARVELGYLLSSQTLALSDAALDGPGAGRESSIRELWAESGARFSSILRGPESFGGLLQARGVRAVPGPADPSPGGHPYFRGGYSTRRHGSALEGEVVSAIQLEHPFQGVRESAEARAEYARRLADAVRQYMRSFYGPSQAEGEGAGR